MTAAMTADDSDHSAPATGDVVYRPGGYQPALDGLRAISIVLVLLYHNDCFLRGGYLGVDIFFVLSGFLITSLLFDEWRRRQAIAIGRFYLRRVLRLFPALGVLLATGLLFVLCFPRAPQSPKILRAVGYSVLYVANWATANDSMALGPFSHTWSLAVEEQFYLLWPFLLMFLLRKLGDDRRLPLAILALALLSAVWRAFLFVGGSTPWQLYNGTTTRADSLLVGAAAAVAMVRGDLPRVLGGARAVRWLALATLPLLGWLVVRQWLEWKGYDVGGFFLVAVAATLWVVAVLSNPTWVVTRALSWQPLTWIGKLSYSLYLWHLPIYGFVKPERLGLGATTVFFVRLALAFAAAVASHYLVERPFLRMKRRIGSKPVDRAPVPSFASNLGDS